MKIKLSERERWFLFFTVLFVVFYIFALLAFNPKAAENDALRTKLKTLDLELNTVKQKAKFLQALEITPLQKVREKKTKETQVIEALHYISNEVSRLKLNMLSVRPQMQERAVDSAKVVFFELTFTGRYNTIYRFMAALERLPILILVDSMTMQKSSGSDIKVDMVLSVYY